MKLRVKQITVGIKFFEKMKTAILWDYTNRREILTSDKYLLNAEWIVDQLWDGKLKVGDTTRAVFPLNTAGSGIGGSIPCRKFK